MRASRGYPALIFIGNFFYLLLVASGVFKAFSDKNFSDNRFCRKFPANCSYQEFHVIRRPVRKGFSDWPPQGKIPDYIQAMPVFFLRRSLYKLLFFLITEAPYYFNP